MGLGGVGKGPARMRHANDADVTLWGGGGGGATHAEVAGEGEYVVG